MASSTTTATTGGEVQRRDRIYIDGAWVPSSGAGTIDEINAATEAEAFTPGDPFAEGTRLGPLVSETQRERVRAYIRKGIEEGAKLVTGGLEAPEGLNTGYFVRPTVFS